MAVIPDVVRQIGQDEQDALETLLLRLDAKRRRHLIRSHYYDGTNVFKDLGIAIPPALRSISAPMGWPAKAVDSLGDRVKNEGFVLPGGDIASWGVDEVWRANRMNIEAPQAQTSALIHSVAFISTSLGDTQAGEPEVVIGAHTATDATGLWHPTKRALGAALVIFERDDFGPTKLVLMFPGRVHSIWREDNLVRWHVRTIPNPLGRIPVEPLVFRPRLGRPFGSSRISRPVMGFTDSAMRTIVRAEVGAEFFSAPQRYLLGADEEQFIGSDGTRKTTWDLLMGRLLAIPRDEETGDVPEVGQFAQISMQPHNEQMRMWASLFAAETGLSVSSLGIIQDNPSSAEAIYAAKEDLVITAERTCETFEPAWVNTVKTAIQIRDNLPTVPAELSALGIRWRDPSTPSRASAVDAVTKEIGVGLLPVDSEVALERAGYSDLEIQRILAERRRSAGRAAIEALLNRNAPATPEQPTVV